MILPLLHRCTKMVLLKKEMRRKGRHLRSYRHQAYRRLRMMRKIREELLQKVRQAIEARQRDMVLVQKEQARQGVAKMLATYKRWLHSWSRSLLSQRRLIGQQQQLERQLDRRLRLLRKQLGRHREPQRLLDRCFLKLRKALEKVSHLHPTIEGQAHIWEQEAEELRRYLSQDNRKKVSRRKTRNRKMLHGFSDFWDAEVLRRRSPPVDDMTSDRPKPSSGRIYAVPEVPVKPLKPKKKKNAEPEDELVDVPLKPKRLKKKLKKSSKNRTSDSGSPKPTIEELEQLYAEQIEGRQAGRESKPKKTQRKGRKRSRTRHRMNMKKLLDLDRPSEDVSVKSKVVRKKSATRKEETMDSGLSVGTKAKVKSKRKQSLINRKRKESRGMPQKSQVLSDIGPQLKSVKKPQKKPKVEQKQSKLKFRRLEVEDNQESNTNEKENMSTKENRTENKPVPYTAKRGAKEDMLPGDLFPMEAEYENANNLGPTDSEISMQNMLSMDKNVTEIEQKPLVKTPKRRSGSRKSSGPSRRSLKRKKSNADDKGKEIQPVEVFMPGKLRLQRPVEPGPEDSAPKYLDEDNNEKLGYSFHLKELQSDVKFSALQRLLRSVIERNSVLDGVVDVHALMSVVGKHNMWNNLSGLHKELLATGIDKSDIVELLSKKYLDNLRAIVDEFANNPLGAGKSATSSKYKMSSINVPVEIAQNIGWLNEHTRGRPEDVESPLNAASRHGLYEMGNAPGSMDRNLLKQLIDEERQMERDLREERRRKLLSGNSGRFTSTSSMSLCEIHPTEEHNLENVEMRYSVKSIRNMLQTYTQHFQSLAKSPVLLALEKERSITEARLKAMREQSWATRPQTYTGKRRRFNKKKALRSAQRLFYAPRQTCRVKNLNDSDDCECVSEGSDEHLDEDVWPCVYEKCPRCGVKVALPSPTPPESVRSLSQSSIEACAKNELMLSTVADICIRCGYIHDKCQSCPQLPISPVSLKQLWRVEEAAQAHKQLEPPCEKQQEEVLLCCSPCGILKKATRYADR